MRSNKVRKRVAQACQRCRQRKFKCDGLKPECSTCQQASQMCLYESHVRRRGLPEGYVRGLELLASLAIRHIDKFEECLLSRLLQKDDEHRFEWHSDFDHLLDGWRNSQLAVELENLLPFLPSPKSQLKRKFEDNQFAVEGPRRSWTHVSTPQPTYDIDKSLLLEDDRTQGQSDTSQLPGQLRSNTLFENRPLPERTITTCSAQSPPTSIRLPAQVGSLVRIYFSQTHCWFPIVDKTEIMRSIYCYINEKPEIIPCSGKMALVWAITASTSSQLLKSGRLGEYFETGNASRTLVSSFYTKCREMIPSEEGPFEIEHVQALLLLSLINIDQSEWSAAWMLIGKAVRIVTDLDCASPIGTDSRPPRRLKETFLGCFVLDTLVAFYLSRSPHLREEDVDKIGLVDEDGLDDWDVWSNPLDTTCSSHNQYFPLFTLSSFNRLVNTCKAIQSVSLSHIYGKKSFSRDQILQNLERDSTREPFDGIFKTQITSNLLENKWLPHHYHLRLIYLLTVSELSPRSNSIEDSRDTRSQALEKSACFAEIRALLEVLGDRFGVHSMPQTHSLIVALLARSEMPTLNDPTGIHHQSKTLDYRSSQGRGEPSHSLSRPPRQETLTQNRGTRPSLTEMEPNDGSGQLDRELEQGDSLTDSNSIFNDFVALDTSKWTSNWEEGLFNLGFTASSSANDFYEFIEPST